MRPPVDGLPLDCSAEVAVTCTWLPVVLLPAAPVFIPMLPLWPWMAASLAAMAARSVVAILAASACLRCTTQMLPAAPLLLWLLSAGWSSLRIRLRASSACAWVGARSSRALLRGSGSTVVRLKPVAAPVAAWAAMAPAPLPSSRRCTSGAMSVATP